MYIFWKLTTYDIFKGVKGVKPAEKSASKSTSAAAKEDIYIDEITSDLNDAKIGSEAKEITPKSVTAKATKEVQWSKESDYI